MRINSVNNGQQNDDQQAEIEPSQSEDLNKCTCRLVAHNAENTVIVREPNRLLGKKHQKGNTRSATMSSEVNGCPNCSE